MGLFGKSNDDKKLDLFNKGLSLIKLEKYPEAGKYYNEALKIDPNYVDPLMGLILISTKLEMYPEIILLCDKIIKLFPEGLEVILSNKGFALINLERYEEALVCFDEVIRINPENSDGWYNKGKTLAELGRDDEAKQCFRKATDLDES